MIEKQSNFLSIRAYDNVEFSSYTCQRVISNNLLPSMPLLLIV